MTQVKRTLSGDLEATEYVSHKGYDWRISTHKTSRGLIVCTAYAGKYSKGNGYDSFSCDIMSAPNYTLVSEKARATEGKIKELHLKGMALFDAKKDADELPANDQYVYEIEPGQILFLNGYGQDEHNHNRHAIYQIENGRFGTTYHCVCLDTLTLHRHDRAKNITKKFGIGIYYREGDKVDMETVTNALIEAKQKEAAEKRKAEAEKILADQVRAAKIEEGKTLINIPDWAESVIVADLYQDDSESYTDYFATSVQNTYYLAWSKHKRNNMQELRKAAENWDTTRELLKEPKTVEYTHGHSYLPDYYIGSESWNGWKVNKRKYFDLTKESTREEIYIAASEGRVVIPGPSPVSQNDTTDPESPKVASLQQIEVIDYSEKAIALRGDTKAIKEQLKELGGRFNPRLTDPATGEKFAGWIFSKKKQEDINKLVRDF